MGCGPGRRTLARRAGWTAAAALGLVLAAVLLLGCTPPPRPNFRQEILTADRDRDWGLVYFQSWQKEHNQDYLLLARQRTQQAVSSYLDVQRRMGYSFPDFYIVDRRRMASCIFLRQMQAEAASFAVKLEDTARVGCYD